MDILSKLLLKKKGKSKKPKKLKEYTIKKVIGKQKKKKIYINLKIGN